MLQTHDVPLVSVVVPAFNGQDFIARTLDSCLAQSHRNLEVIVVDDGSTDQTAAIVQSFAAKDPRVSLHSKPNGGVASARNFGLERAAGRYVAFLDADDLWHPAKIERQLAKLRPLEPSGYAAVYALNRTIGLSDEVEYDLPNFEVEGWVLERHTFCNFISNGSNLLCRADVARAVGGFDPTLTSTGMAADRDFQLKVVRYHKLALVAEYLVGYRRHPASMSAAIWPFARSLREVAERHLQGPISPQCRRWTMGQVLSYELYAHLASSQFPRAIASWTRMLFVDPERALSAVFIRPLQALRRTAPSPEPSKGASFLSLDPTVGKFGPPSKTISDRLRRLAFLEREHGTPAVAEDFRLPTGAR